MKQQNGNRTFQYLVGIFAVCAVAGISFLFSGLVGYKLVAFLLLVTVSVLAMLFDIWPVLLASVLSAVVWDFFFIPPRFTFTIGTTEDRIFFLMYFIIASVNAALTFKIRQVEKEARRKEGRENAIRLYKTIFNSLSHELRTPISAIIGATDTLKDNEKLSDKNKAALIDEISIASLRLNEQVENLLNMSRLETGQLQLKKDWCDVNELIYSSVNRLKAKSLKHKIEIRIPENFPFVKLDFGIMEQVLFNLLNNALQYTPENSIIRVSAEVTATTSGHIEENGGQAHHDSKTHTIHICVADNGSGFPENEIENVFGKFYRLRNSRAGGTGLGLSIVKGFVNAHRGNIRLRNLPEGGAEFIIDIPVEVSFLNALKNE